MSQPFHIYRSSAGSGKTRTLAREYILLALRHPDDFRFTLAVSFANKSAQEMKDRIIRYLGEFANGIEGDLGPEIRASLNLSSEQLQEKSRNVLSAILHQYSQFSISTIDAFFQRVIRAFTRESGLLGNFRLEVENERVMDEVIAELIDDLGPDEQEMTDWVIQFSSERLKEGDSWNIANELKEFSKELFKENYKEIADDVQRAQKDLKPKLFLDSLRKVRTDFMAAMKVLADEALGILNANGMTAFHFSYGDKGTALKFFQEYAQENFMEPGTRVESSARRDESWETKTKSPALGKLNALADAKLRPLLNDMLTLYHASLKRYVTSQIVEENFHAYGLLGKITEKLNTYKTENNIMLLSDASHFLNGVIRDSDTPFLYEKIGSFYRHYLIDEFQDTSGLQWNNFKPLFNESLDQNFRSLVVGDVKQSIYRWRGSDLGLLQQAVESEIGAGRTLKTALDQNWRSAGNLVRFNNALFKAAAALTTTAASHELPAEVFADVEQKTVKFEAQGFVNIRFLEKASKEDDTDAEALALRMIPTWLEELQGQGISPGDITILVRKNKEGQRIADYLMQFKKSAEAKTGVKYEVVSNESLRLEAASSVLLLLSALRYLSNPDDAIARGELSFETYPGSPEENEYRFRKAGVHDLKGLVPDEFLKSARWLVKLSLFELTETLIRMFGLGASTTEVVYLQSFQDVILEFGGKDKNDIASFLEWWEEIKDERSVQVPAQREAANIFTIHKSKGLQFKYVIVPFCNWNMSHDPFRSPILWARTDEEPFSTLGHTAIKFKGGLEDSYFADDYRTEYTKSLLDNLNLLYVAFTRAEEGLMVMATRPVPSKKPTNKIGTVGHLLFNAITGSALNEFYDASLGEFKTGAIEILAPRKTDETFMRTTLANYSAIDWQQRLVIRRDGQEFFQEEKSHKRQLVNYGILIHTILSRIVHRDDADDVLRSVNFEGMILESERVPLLAKIKDILTHPVAGSWFGKEWHVRTETPVILPGGRLARIDRVISREVVVKGQTRKKAVIIDYKTGVRKNSDNTQVEEYAQILSSMGYYDVEGYLLYVDDLAVVKVMDKMNLNLF